MNKKLGGEWIWSTPAFTSLPITLLENMNKEPADAEVKYLGFNLEECRYFFDNLKSPSLEGIDGFLGGLDVKRMARSGSPIAGVPRRSTSKPGQGNIDFAGMFRKLDALGYRGHFTTAFDTLQDMIEGREYLAAQGQKAGLD